MRRITRVGVVVAAATASLMVAEGLHAQAVITNGTVSLGVGQTGELNIDAEVPYYGGIGVRHNASGWDGTYDGCTCEGWGAGISGGTYDRTASEASTTTGYSNLNDVSFESTASTATSGITMRSGSTDLLRVTHHYAPAPETSGLYRVTVTMTNLTGETLGSGDQALRYRRAMDWDIPYPRPEQVTLRGWGAENLIGMSTDGFADANPFSTLGGICGVPVNTNVTNVGPCDHGAVFDFAFPQLGAGESRSFNIFYGAFANLDDARAGLGAVGAEVGSWAFCTPGTSVPGSLGGGTCEGANGTTFVFGFEGVGGEVIEPPPPTSVVPEPSTVLMMGTGLLGLAVGAHRRRRRAA